MKRTKVSEEDLAEILVKRLRKKGWTVYQEVQVRRGGRTADIVAARNSEVWVIEVKNTLGLAVLGQAYYWRPWATYISVAVPVAKSKKSAGRKFAYKVMHDYQIGLLEIDALQNKVYEVARMAPHKRANLKKFAKVVTDRHQTYAKAGNAEGKKLTPYKLTCERLLSYVQAHPGVYLKEALQNIEYHYSSSKSALSTMRKRFRLLQVPNLQAWWDPTRKDYQLWEKTTKQTSC